MDDQRRGPAPLDSELSRLRAVLGERFRVDGPVSSRAGRKLYTGYDTQSRRDVVVKVIAFDPTRYPELADRLEYLLRTASEIGHAAVVPPACMAVMEDGLLYLSPLEPGGSLAEQLASSKPMPLGDVRRIVGEVAQSLSAVHARGLVHGSLTPDNIVFGADSRARVSDIGVSEALRSAGLMPGGGTAHELAFAAPEQWRGECTGSHTDQYSLALIAYEMLTGHRRLAATGAGRVKTLDPIEIHAHVPLGRGIPLYVNEALRVALSANPAMRYATISQFADAFSGRAPDEARGLPTYRADVGMARRTRIAPLVFGLLAAGALVIAINSSAEKAAVELWDGMWGRYIPPKVELDASLSLDPASGARPANPTTAPGVPSGTGGTGTRGSTPGAVATNPSGSASPPAPSLNGVRLDPTGTGRLGPEIEVRLGRPNTLPGTILESDPRPGAATDSANGSPTSGSAAVASSWAARLKRSLMNLVSAPAPTAYVYVEVSGGSAVVSIDGIPRGTTPLVASVGAGHHIVSVTGTSTYDPSSMGITAAVGDTARVVFRAVSPH